MYNPTEVNNRELFFDHINKTAGSSVEEGVGLKFQHKTAPELRQEVGQDRWNAGFSFSFVRNPWDRVVSLYHWRVKTNQTQLAERPVPFSDWVVRSFGEQNPAYYDKPRMFMQQIDWLTDFEPGRRGEILVDFVGRYENLELHYDHIISASKSNQAKPLPHMKPSERNKNYVPYYAPQTAEIIADWFADDIREFGYVFGE